MRKEKGLLLIYVITLSALIIELILSLGCSNIWGLFEFDAPACGIYSHGFCSLIRDPCNFYYVVLGLSSYEHYMPGGFIPLDVLFQASTHLFIFLLLIVTFNSQTNWISVPVKSFSLIFLIIATLLSRIAIGGNFWILGAYGFGYFVILASQILGIILGIQIFSKNWTRKDKIKAAIYFAILFCVLVVFSILLMIQQIEGLFCFIGLMLGLIIGTKLLDRWN